MSDKIEPTLTAEEIDDIRHLGAQNGLGGILAFISSRAFEGDWAKVVAVAMGQLPDSDSRKITREKLAAIRDNADALEADYESYGKHAAFVIRFRELADVLESYLPPVAQND